MEQWSLCGERETNESQTAAQAAECSRIIVVAFFTPDVSERPSVGRFEEFGSVFVTRYLYMDVYTYYNVRCSFFNGRKGERSLLISTMASSFAKRRPLLTSTKPTLPAMESAKDMNQLYISSSDSLRNRRIIQTIPPGWNDRPPLFAGGDQDELLKGMSRTGIPPALRCAVWISSVVKSCHPHQPPEYSNDYRTLGKVRQIDYAWETVLKQVFPNPGDEVHALPPTFGNTSYKDCIGGPLPDYGEKSVTRVLMALHYVVGLDYAPLLPTLAIVSLSFMSESYAYSMLREMAHNASCYVPTSPLEHVAWCRAFMDVLQRLHPQTAVCLRKCNVEGSSGKYQGLDPIFKLFFLPVLKFVHVLRIMDIYVLEGSKVIFRFGVALLCMFKKDWKEIEASTPEEWWSQLKEYTHSFAFSMDTLVRKAYGYHGNRARRRMRFPRRHILARIIRLEEERASQQVEFEPVVSASRPLALISPDTCKLLKGPEIRSHLATWLPVSLRLSKLELLFSTDIHGRTLERFYSHVSGSRLTITVIQVLENDAVIGMFASQAWRISPKVYGDGECFLFRASPDAQCYKWKPSTVDVDVIDDDESSTAKSRALLEQFQVGRPDFISMGGNPDGTCGLRLNEDLTRGESAAAVGFGNDGPLVEGMDVFDVGLVEVYRLVQMGESFDDHER